MDTRVTAQEAVDALIHLFSSRALSLDAQFSLLENRTAEQKQNTKNALDAALKAAGQTISDDHTAPQPDHGGMIVRYQEEASHE